MVRPKCENCGERLYQIQGQFKKYFWGDIPQHCPKCGAKIDFDIKSQLIEHDDLIWLLLCIPVDCYIKNLLVIVLNN